MFDVRFYLYSILIHVVIVAAMAYTVDWNQQPSAGPALQPKALQAHSVDKQAVDAEIERMQRRETAKAEAMRKQLEALENERRQAALKTEAQQQATERLLREARKKAAAETERVAKLKRQQREEAKRVAALQERQKAEQARLAKLKAEQKEAERKKALEAEKERQRKKAAAAARKREQERKREAAEAERRRKAAEQALQAELQAEKEALARQRADHLSRLRFEYQSLIRQKVARNWIKRSDFDKNWACRIRVIQNVAGDVVRVEPVSCDGTEAYRDSVVRAVHRASPLPKPPSPDVFEREILFNFKEQ